MDQQLADTIASDGENRAGVKVAAQSDGAGGYRPAGISWTAGFLIDAASEHSLSHFCHNLKMNEVSFFTDAPIAAQLVSIRCRWIIRNSRAISICCGMTTSTNCATCCNGFVTGGAR